MVTTRAAVLAQAGVALQLSEVELADPGPHQVRVRLAATGVCHSDLSVRDGRMPYPLPAVLGHEGAGVVVEVGERVTRVAPGDHVVLTWIPPCRDCAHCRRGHPVLCERGLADMLSAPYGTWRGQPVHAGFGTATFADETLVLERSVVPIETDIPLEVAALVGCAVATGVGAVVNVARPTAGDTVAIVGCGGVGLAAVQGASLAGAGRVIAVDRVSGKLELARRLGATDTIDAADSDPVAAVRDLTRGGVDVALEVVGVPETVQQAFAMTRRGGTTVLVGAGSPLDTVTFGAMELFVDAKTIVGCVYGDTDPDRDFPRLLGLYRSGRLRLDELVSRRVSLDDLDDAFAAMEAGEVARSVVVFE